MTGLQIYLLVAPFILLATGIGAAYFWIAWYDRPGDRTKQSTPRK